MSSSSSRGYALITGASSGIGAALACEYAQRGVPLILTARRQERLEALAAQLRPQVAVEVIPADLADPNGVSELCRQLQARELAVRVLVNNAGYGVPGRYTAHPWSTHAAFLQVMVGAVCELTWQVMPSLRKFPDGRILNVASLAGLMPGAPGQTLYAAVKAFMIKFSESLALENRKAGMKVCALCPGFTWSEFHDVTGTRAMMDQLPKRLWLQADAVARAGIEGMERGRIIVVPGWRYRLLYGLTRHLTDQARFGLMGRHAAKIRKVD